MARLETAAIQLLSEQLSLSIEFLPGVYHLPAEDMEELRNDALLVTLQKMTDGGFEFQGHEPATYATAVARRLLANRLRKRKLDTVELDGHDQPPRSRLPKAASRPATCTMCCGKQATAVMAKRKSVPA